MTRWMTVAALLVLAAAPAQAHGAKRHRHHHAVAVSYPDSVTLEGKVYKVCKAGQQDDCVQPREAGLGSGAGAAQRHHSRAMDRHR